MAPSGGPESKWKGGILMKMERRDFLKTGAVALGAASLGTMAGGVIQKSAVAEAAEAPDYKVYALK